MLNLSNLKRISRQKQWYDHTIKVLIFCFGIFSLSLFELVYSQTSFEEYFCESTCRLDYFHTGTAETEIFSLDQIYEEGPWPGPKVDLDDDLGLGLYQAQINDKVTHALLFSYGFCSIFGEWQTTQEAIDGISRTFHETIRFPMPHNPVLFTLNKREGNSFKTLWTVNIDPRSRFINREKKVWPYSTTKIIDNGASTSKVDLLIMGDGYSFNDLEKFRSDVQRYTNVLFSSPPFMERQNDFNVWIIEVSSPESGIDEPRKNIWKHNCFGTTYNSFDVARYVLSFGNKEIHDVASLVPYDAIYILFNSPRYGGGGIYNCLATCYTGSENNQPTWWSDYVFVHEFGHSFAGLADEYYSSDVAYNDMYPTSIEPWEPNITTLMPDGHPKWQALLTPNVEIPTPWRKVEYDSLSQKRNSINGDSETVQALKDSLDVHLEAILNDHAFGRITGAFEGGGYAPKGVYRPSINCRMFSKSLVEFCPVCQNAICKVIDHYAQISKSDSP